jgi:hypothetical protein
MKTGHFYFGKKRTFLNWLDKQLFPLDNINVLDYIVTHSFFSKKECFLI